MHSESINDQFWRNPEEHAKLPLDAAFRELEFGGKIADTADVAQVRNVLDHFAHGFCPGRNWYGGLGKGGQGVRYVGKANFFGGEAGHGGTGQRWEDLLDGQVSISKLRGGFGPKCHLGRGMEPEADHLPGASKIVVKAAS